MLPLRQILIRILLFVVLVCPGRDSTAQSFNPRFKHFTQEDGLPGSVNRIMLRVRTLFLPFLLFLWTFLLIHNSLIGQLPTGWFKHLTLEDGLASTTVTSFLQDSKGFIWIGTWKGLHRYDGYQLKAFTHDPEDSTSLLDDAVYCIFEDSKNRLWIGTSQGVDRFEPVYETFLHYPCNYLVPGQDDALCIAEDKNGRLWTGFSGGFFQLIPESREFIPFTHDSTNVRSISYNYISSICPVSDGSLWIGTDNGLNLFLPDKGYFQRFFTNPNDPLSPASVSDNQILKISEGPDGTVYIVTKNKVDMLKPKDGRFVFSHKYDGVTNILQDKRDGSLWMGTTSGLVHELSTDGNHVEKYVGYPSYTEGLSSSIITTLYQDREGSIWIGTRNGVNIHSEESLQFKHYQHNPYNLNSISQNQLTSAIESKDQKIWIGTRSEGLNCLDPKTGKVTRFPYDLSGKAGPYATNNNSIFNIMEDRFGYIWVGLNRGGLDRLDRRTNTFTHFSWGDKRDRVSYMYEDKEGTLWIGHEGGVSRYIRADNRFVFYSYAPEANRKSSLGVVTGILQDHTGTFWVGSTSYFLNKFNPLTGKYQPFYPDPDNPHSIASKNIQSIYEDKKGQIWVGTDNGLNLFNREQETFSYWGLKEGLPALVMGQIAEDENGFLWLPVGKGITKYDPVKNSFKNYDKRDGLSSDESWNFAKRHSTGEMMLATINGLTIFHPDSLRENPMLPPIVFTKMARYNSDIKKLVDVKGISEKDEITLFYKDNILSFEFAALSYRKTAKNQYAYQLEGFNDNWIPLGTKREITFTNLDPGAYTLRVKGSNGDGVWNEEGTSLKIIITPPWWRTWWAYILYALTGATLLFGIWQYDLRRKLARAEAQRLKELDTFKSRLYTNITHEFRTPLTIISGMADQILEQPQRWLEEGIHAIKRNSAQLLRLVNQMLDMQKLEAGKMPLNMVQGDVLIYLKYLVESFESQARTKEIDLHFETNLPELVMDYDPDKLQQIVSNLLFNALKFTKAEGEVRLSVGFRNLHPDSHRDGHLELECSDTGAGISPEKLPFIFDRFFQADPDSYRDTRQGEGTGIGLALTRELVKLLGGKISVKSEPGLGSEFTVVLPVTRKAPLVTGTQENWLVASPQAAAALPSAGSENIAAQNDNLPQALIIEDNADVQQYLAVCLENACQVTVAVNGREGIEKAIECIPDIVISDVMMPEKDGFEVCETLKNDIRTSHIPVILLTAKADAESRLHGLSCGADAYLAKPFDKKELLVRIEKLLELRQKLQEHYFTQDAANASAELPESATREQIFVKKVKTMVEEHLSDYHFSIEELSRELAMSRSQLHRKVTAVTGVSPNRYVRYLRLQKASQLLVETDETIAAIAYDTGFSDPAYFTRVFSQEFGMTPSEFRETHDCRN